MTEERVTKKGKVNADLQKVILVKSSETLPLRYV